MHPLDINLSSPLEREYEAWIIAGIEQYFRSLHIKAYVWAVSPAEEVYWPADEKILVNSRLIGLQHKKVDYKGTVKPPRDFGMLNWTFHNPSGQFALVLKFPEIYYCLPTFINRDYREQALHHCLFWRPNENAVDRNAWYNNDSARTPHKAIYGAPRWGLFVEQMYSDNAGKKFAKGEDAHNYLKSIRGFMMNPPMDDIVVSPESSEYIDGLTTTNGSVIMIAII